MANNKMIGKCKNCDQWYCMECCENEKWDCFCSVECEEEFEKEEEKALFNDEKVIKEFSNEPDWD